MKRAIKPLAVFIAMLGSGAALAQKTEIPAELLDLDRQRCLTDCVPGFGEETCKPLCECTVAEFKKRLDFDKYLDLSAQLSRNELNAENRGFLDSVAKYCTAQLDKAGVPVGGGK